MHMCIEEAIIKDHVYRKITPHKVRTYIHMCIEEAIIKDHVHTYTNVLKKLPSRITHRKIPDRNHTPAFLVSSKGRLPIL